MPVRCTKIDTQNIFSDTNTLKNEHNHDTQTHNQILPNPGKYTITAKRYVKKPLILQPCAHTQ